MKRIILALAVASLSLSACITVPGGGAPTKADTIQAVATVAAKVADAANVSPPASIWTPAAHAKAAQALRLAFSGLDHADDVIDAFVKSGRLVRNSPAALTVRRGILATQAALNAASSAERAGSAASYAEALKQAESALASVQSAIGK